MSEEVVEKKKELTEKQLEKLAAKHKGPKYKTTFGDKMISVVTYIVYSIFAFVCLYPFYYIFISSCPINVPMRFTMF